MKIRKSYHTTYIILLFSIFIIAECAWFMYIYQVEAKIFTKNIEQQTKKAITEEIWANKKQTEWHLDLRKKDRMLMSYHLEDKNFYIDTNKYLLNIYTDRGLYDFSRSEWSTDSMAHHFRRYCPSPDLSITFIRQDRQGKILDTYPSEASLPERAASLPAQQLGNIHTDTLSAWFQMPLSVLWGHQRLGLLFSALLFLSATYYFILIIRKIRIECYNHSQLEKQTIFIHDLKTPLCTNRNIEERILKNIDTWPSGKIQDKLGIALERSQQIGQDIRQFISCSTDSEKEFAVYRFDLKELLQHIIDRHTSGTGHRITLAFGAEETEITGNPFHIEHMADNLISNAIKYAGEQEEICVSCRKGKRKRLIIKVKDSGRQTAVPQKQEPSQKSHGLGLAYIRNTMRHYKGNFQIESQTGKGTECTLVFKPESQPKAKGLSPYIYHCFTFVLGVAMLTWAVVLLLTERRQIAEKESVTVYEASKSSAIQLIKWRVDTVYFKNNWQEQTVTITRYAQDTTIPMGDNTSQLDLYSRLGYDLRGPLWKLDSMAAEYYSLSDRPYPAAFSRLDAQGKVLEHMPAPDGLGFWPVGFQTPLGYVERHVLQTYLGFPWAGFLADHLLWFVMAGLYLLFMGWAGFLLSGYERRQRAFRRFRYGKNQQFMVELQDLISQIHRNEVETDAIVRNDAGETGARLLERNIRYYEDVLQKINLLLDRTTALQRL